jgi:PKD repeat protein
MIGLGLYTVYGIANDPSTHLKALELEFNVSITGPSASFRWNSQGYNVTFADTSTDNGSTITNWEWDFGDGTSYSGRAPPTHTYRATCPMCSEQVTLGVTDVAGNHSVATAHVSIQRFGSSSGVGQSPTPSVGGIHSGGLASALPGALELLLVMFLIGISGARAGWHLLRYEPESISVPVRPPSPRE